MPVDAEVAVVSPEVQGSYYVVIQLLNLLDMAINTDGK